jgi:hypothetical protein
MVGGRNDLLIEPNIKPAASKDLLVRRPRPAARMSNAAIDSNFFGL